MKQPMVCTGDVARLPSPTPSSFPASDQNAAPAPHVAPAGGLLRQAQVEEFHVITWESPKEQIFEMPTGGAAIMRKGPNLLKLARKEQTLALLSQLRSKFKLNGLIYRVFPNGEVQYLHPKVGPACSCACLGPRPGRSCSGASQLPAGGQQAWQAASLAAEGMHCHVSSPLQRFSRAAGHSHMLAVDSRSRSSWSGTSAPTARACEPHPRTHHCISQQSPLRLCCCCCCRMACTPRRSTPAAPA